MGVERMEVGGEKGVLCQDWYQGESLPCIE
jgi:hypothetical protein